MSEVLVVGPLLLRVSVLGFVVMAVSAVWLAGRVAARAGVPPAWPRHCLQAALLAGVACARAGHVLEHWPAYAARPWTALQPWLPGFEPWYGIAGGVAAAMLVARRRPPSERWRGLGAVLAGTAGGSALAAAVVLAALVSSPAGPARAGELPPVDMVDLEGRAVSGRDLRGRLAVVNVWASWCAPCVREMPLLDETARAWAGRGVVVVGLNLAEPRGAVADFVARTGVGYAVWVDPPGAEVSPSRRLFESLGGQGLPTTWFVGPDGGSFFNSISVCRYCAVLWPIPARSCALLISMRAS